MNLSEDRWGNPTWEAIVGVPEEIVETSTWPDWDTPLRQLKAICLKHLGDHEPVGEPFRFSNEWIRLDEDTSTSYDRWSQLRLHDKTISFWCGTCGCRTRHAPKGAVEVEG